MIERCLAAEFRKLFSTCTLLGKKVYHQSAYNLRLSAESHNNILNFLLLEHTVYHKTLCCCEGAIGDWGTRNRGKGGRVRLNILHMNYMPIRLVWSTKMPFIIMAQWQAWRSQVPNMHNKEATDKKKWVNTWMRDDPTLIRARQERLQGSSNSSSLNINRQICCFGRPRYVIDIIIAAARQTWKAFWLIILGTHIKIHWERRET